MRLRYWHTHKEGSKSLHTSNNNLPRCLAALLLCWLFILPATATVHTSEVQIKEVRVWPSPDGTRIVLGLNSAAEYKSFTLENPNRLVIDFKAANMIAKTSHINWDATPVLQLRQALFNKNDLRLVLDLKQKIPYQVFSLPPNGNYGNRVVVDLGAKENNSVAQPHKPKKSLQDPPAIINTSTDHFARNFVLAIDAGHGGEDPGAIGLGGTREKDVVLAIARDINTLAENAANIKPYMVRDGDYYVGLRQRLLKARAKQADLFVSIHADAFRDHNAHGASVYTLSQRGASSEAARWLAESENRADLVGGVKLGGKDEVLASVLLDLSQTASSEASARFGKMLLTNLGHFSRLHSPVVQQAGFLVLKSPDIPSVLIETGFISHPETEHKLQSRPYQQKVAQAIMEAVSDYFRNQVRQPESPRLYYAANGGRGYVIQKGDTLADIAHRFGTTEDALRLHNKVNGDRISVGQKLQIPQS